MSKQSEAQDWITKILRWVGMVALILFVVGLVGLILFNPIGIVLLVGAFNLMVVWALGWALLSLYRFLSEDNNDDTRSDS